MGTCRCPPSTFMSSYFERCQECLPNCDICNSSNSCKQCTKPYEIDIDGKCTLCPVNTFYHPKTQLCKKCVLKDGRCNEPRCEKGMYFEDTSESCKNCAKNCHKCEAFDTCDKCNQGFYFDKNLHVCSQLKVLPNIDDEISMK